MVPKQPKQHELLLNGHGATPGTKPGLTVTPIVVRTIDVKNDVVTEAILNR